MGEEIIVARDGNIATITLNRPAKRNAINYNGWLELRRIAVDLDDDESVRAVVITGAGDKAFSAGADIKEFELYRNSSKKARIYGEAFGEALRAVEAISKPTICLIKGFCLGGGCELSMAADLRIASEDSRFGVPVAHLGILVGYAEMSRLLNLIGPGNTNYFLLTGRTIDAIEALRIGLINAVYPLSEIDEVVYSLARDAAQLAPLSHKRNKRIMQIVLRNPSVSGLTNEEEHLPFINFDSEDFREALKAFAEKRTPEFRGK
jgi:enoyl-CoA hydratase/carnithine racemase